MSCKIEVKSYKVIGSISDRLILMAIRCKAIKNSMKEIMNLNHDQS